MSDYMPSEDAIWERLPLGMASKAKKETTDGKPAGGTAAQADLQPVRRDQAGQQAVPVLPVSRIQGGVCGRSRDRDPETSKRAGQTKGLRGQKLAVWQALARGPAGQSEIAERCGLLAHQVNKRLADLQSDGLAAPTSEMVQNTGGRLERLWRATRASGGPDAS